MRPVSLTAVEGIDRLRTRGGARVDHLYDFVNAYRRADGSAHVRPGTRRIVELPAGTHGLTAFDGKLHVFASSPVSVDDARFALHLLLHPEEPGTALARIHFAEPFLGALYVVAEFADGGVFHYWLQRADAWTAETEIAANEFRTPTTPNGYVYRATRLGNPYPAWAPGVPRAEADRVEPTTYNEYWYEAIATVGENPRSGTFEPIWPTHTGERIVESADDTEAPRNTYPTPPAPPAPNQPQSASQSKYGL